jgi:hypothetical protein
MVSHGLRSEGRFGIENDTDAPAPALRAHHSIFQIRNRHLSAPRPDKRLKVQLPHVVALSRRVCLIDSAVDAFRMDAPSRRHGIAEGFDRHENN